MTRSELVAKIAAENPKLTQAEADKIVRMIFDSMTETLAQGGRVELRGFGVFGLRQRDPRKGRNPSTGDVVDVEAKAVPFFKTSNVMHARLNGE